MAEKMNVSINTEDWDGMRQLMKTFGNCDFMLNGKNADGEHVTVSIACDNIVNTTYQNNGWVRKNVFWHDGTAEEMFDGRWK